MTKLTGTQLKNYKAGLKLTDEQREIIIGTVLGDASFGGLREGKPFYGLEFTQSKKHEGYLLHLYEVFKPFVGKAPSERVVGTNKTADNVTLVFKTYRHPGFIFYHNLFCQLKGPPTPTPPPPHPGQSPVPAAKAPAANLLGQHGPPSSVGKPFAAGPVPPLPSNPPNGGDKLVKRIPSNIDKFLTPRALAYWFMDDGTSTNGTYQFCTDCFSVKEQQLLQNALFKNFNIKANVTKYKNTHRITLLAESRETFISVIQPYINNVECMKYKIT